MQSIRYQTELRSWMRALQAWRAFAQKTLGEHWTAHLACVLCAGIRERSHEEFFLNVESTIEHKKLERALNVLVQKTDAVLPPVPHKDELLALRRCIEAEFRHIFKWLNCVTLQAKQDSEQVQFMDFDHAVVMSLLRAGLHMPQFEEMKLIIESVPAQD